MTLVIVAPPNDERVSWLCRQTTSSAPRLIRAWRRRSAMEHTFRTLKHLLATEACQVADADAYDGPLVLRLLAGLVLLSTARVILKGRVTMADMVFSLKHHWRFLTSEHRELQALSWDLPAEAA